MATMESMTFMENGQVPELGDDNESASQAKVGRSVTGATPSNHTTLDDNSSSNGDSNSEMKKSSNFEPLEIAPDEDEDDMESLLPGGGGGDPENPRPCFGFFLPPLHRFLLPWLPLPE